MFFYMIFPINTEKKFKLILFTSNITNIIYLFIDWLKKWMLLFSKEKGHIQIIEMIKSDNTFKYRILI